MNLHSTHKKVHLPSLVQEFMVTRVVSVSSTASLWEVEDLLERRGYSCVPILDDGRVSGVVSRTDLLKAGRREAASRGGSLAPLTGKTAGDVATRPAITVRPKDAASRAAALMVSERIHRVLVQDGNSTVGIFSTQDLLRAISHHRVDTPIRDVMSAPAFTIPLQASISHGTDRLAGAHVTGVVVVDEEDWPVGIFSQREALLACELPGETPIEEAMNPAIVCLHHKAPLHRAATLAAAARVRRVLVVEDRRVVGVVTPLDFARAVSA